MSQQELFNSIYGKSLGDPGNIQLLTNDIEKYPYFTIAHFFYLKEQLKDNKNNTLHAAKTGIYFNHLHRLNIELNSNKEILINRLEKENNSDKPLIKSTDPTESKTTKLEDFLFEPLHTTDYFASQGIKFQEEVQPNDKLGKQLKSFTEWLKTMKKVHGNKLPESGSHIDQTVEQMAEKSNIETEVITEAMAEVFVQQHKFVKAKEIYTKLSLQNPSKNTYFAHKIESLKDK